MRTSTGDNKLERNEDMSVESTTDKILQRMYEKTNKTRDSEEDININLWTDFPSKVPETTSLTFRILDYIRCSAPNWSEQHEFQAKLRMCTNTGKLDTMQSYTDQITELTVN